LKLPPDELAQLQRAIAEFLSKDLADMETSSAEWWRMRQELASGGMSEERAAELRRRLCEQFGPGADTWPICYQVEGRDGAKAFVLGLDPDAGVRPRVPPTDGGA
jgi:hypothetical protein